MKKILIILSILAFTILIVPFALAATVTISSDNTMQWSSDGSTWSSAVATWVHSAWPTISGATWIWRTAQTNPLEEYNSVPEGGWYFKQTFVIPECADPESLQGTITAAADNAYTMSFNGIYLDGRGVMNKDGPDAQSWRLKTSANLTGLVGGENEILFRALNYFNTGTYSSNPAGLIFQIQITNYTDLSKFNVDGDNSNACYDCNDNDATIYPNAIEVCNGLDDDCDEAIDEDYVNTQTTCGVGQCVATGEMICVSGTESNICVAGTPGIEICNGLDDDCDGKVDEGLTAQLSENQNGVCSGSLQICDGNGWIEPIYTLLPYYESTETKCDTLDNNCNGQVDEGGICEYSCITPTTDKQYKTLGLGTNRWVYNETKWITNSPKGKGPTFIPTLTDTHQCGCEQILTWLHENLPETYGEMNGHWKFGCSQSVIQDFIRLADEKAAFTATESLYYNGPTDSAPLYASGPIVFTWNPITNHVTGGYYTEQVPANTGTLYYNLITGGSVVGNDVELEFSRVDPNIYHFTFDGTLVDNVLTGQLDGPYLFTATGTITP